MGWKTLQIGVFIAVLFSDIHYGWAHDTGRLAVVVVAVFSAWIATALAVTTIDLTRRSQTLLFHRHQRIDHRGLTGR